MLIVKRRLEEVVLIQPEHDAEIRIKILRITEFGVELGITAPRSTVVQRLETETKS
ncbi:carbon storage regulator [Ahniella affigens]|nr:carbon storage regulator [Ahniella affigens]